MQNNNSQGLGFPVTKQSHKVRDWASASLQVCYIPELGRVV